MHRFWSLLFATVNLACLGLVVAAYFTSDWWLPDAASTQAVQIDWLFYFIGGLCAFFYVATQLILVVALWRFSSSRAGLANPVHGSHLVEILWTVGPLAGLVVITAVSFPVWKSTKYQGLPASFPIGSDAKASDPDQVILVTARQWDWHFRYPVAAIAVNEIRHWSEDGNPTDIVLADELHVWKGAQVQLLLKSTDVIHSFFVPALRVKQDTLPGKTIPVRFEPRLSNVRFDPQKGTLVPGEQPKTWELVCAELCGGNHYRMRGKLFVHPDKASFLAWLENARQKSRARAATETTGNSSQSAMPGRPAISVADAASPSARSRTSDPVESEWGNSIGNQTAEDSANP